MKRLLLTLAVVIISYFAVSFVGFAETSENYFIGMYKGFFNDLEAKRFQQVWDSLTLPSRDWVAKAINDAAVAQGKSANQTDIRNRLENNVSNLRGVYFENLHKEFQKAAFFKDIKNAQYSIKSASDDKIVITITLGNDPKDFAVIREGNRWKLDFFVDLMR
jgi:hypothetical protein